MSRKWSSAAWQNTRRPCFPPRTARAARSKRKYDSPMKAQSRPPGELTHTHGRVQTRMDQTEPVLLARQIKDFREFLTRLQNRPMNLCLGKSTCCQGHRRVTVTADPAQVQENQYFTRSLSRGGRRPR